MPIRSWNSVEAVSPTTHSTDRSEIAVLSDGSYVITWPGFTTASGDNDIYMQRFDARGNALSAVTLVNSDNALTDSRPSITEIPGGGWAIGWIQGGTAYVQRYNADASSNGAAIPITLSAGGGFNPISLASYSDGRIAVAYRTSGNDIEMKIIATNGSAGAAIIVANAATSEQNVELASNGDRIFVSWLDDQGTGFESLGRIYNNAGTALGAGFILNNVTGNSSITPAVAALSNGNFVAVWYQSSDTSVHGQTYNSSGTEIGSEFSLATTNGDAVDVIGLSGGGFAVSYAFSNARVQLFDTNGVINGPSYLLNAGDGGQTGLGALQDGRLVATFLGAGGVAAQILDPRDGIIDGNGSANVIYGNNFIADTINAGGSADTVYGLGGNDLITGGSGNDRIYGGEGHDTAGYARTFAESSVVRLANGSIRVSNTTDGTDILRGVETLQFSDRTVQVDGYARADVNGDGDSDIVYFSQAGGSIGSFTMQDGFQQGAGALLGSPGSGAWDVQATGDFNYDANSDLVLKNQTTGQFYIWTVLNGVQTGGTSLGTIGTSWDIRTTGDFNADGNSDVLWRDSSNGQFYVWSFNSNLVQTGSTNLGILGTNWDAGQAGDFDGDGDSDVLLRNATNGQIYIYAMQNGAVSSGTSVAVLGTDWTLAATGDFNGDGRSDIALKNTATGQFYLYLMNADLSFTGRDLGTIGTAWNIAATGDYNHDGTDDILWRNATTNQIYAWEMSDGRQATTGSNHLGFVSADTVIV